MVSKLGKVQKKHIFKTDNEVVTDFVYSSELFKKVRKMYLEENRIIKFLRTN